MEDKISYKKLFAFTAIDNIRRRFWKLISKLIENVLI